MGTVCKSKEEVLECIRKGVPFTISEKVKILGLSDGGAKHISDALKVNKTLQTINLGWNKIGDGGAKHISDALKVNKTLQTINLGWNKIGDGGAKHISDALKVNKTLKEISLYNGGAKHISDALKENKTLKEISLHNNNIYLGLKNSIDYMLNSEATLRKKNRERAVEAAASAAASPPSTLSSSASMPPAAAPNSTTPVVPCPTCGADWAGAASVSDAWVAVARRADLFESMSKQLRDLDTNRQALDSAVQRGDSSGRDKALSGVVSSIRALPASVDGLADLIAKLGQPATDISNPEGWRKILTMYEVYEAADFSIPFDSTMHAHAAASLRAELGACIDLDGAKLAELREEAESLERDRMAASIAVADVKAADKCVRQTKRAYTLAKRELEDLEAESDDEDEDEKQMQQARGKVGTTRIEYVRALRKKAHLQAIISELAETYWPELQEHARGDVGGVQLSKHDLDTYEERKTVASSRNVVWSAKLGGRDVILKQFAADTATTELRALQRLSQAPGIVRINAVFQECGSIYVEMPRYKYGGLLEWLRECTPPVELRLRVARRLLAALAAVHLAGIVHCDVKPDNVFVDDEDEPVLGDFDVSCDSKGRTTMLIARTSVGGTLGYIAPEVAGGMVSPAADVYSMGVTLVQLFADGFEVGAGALEVPQEIGGPLRSLLTSMVAADPQVRPTALAATQHACFGTVREAASVIRAIPPTYWTMGGNGGVHYEEVDKEVFQELFNRTTKSQVRFIVESVKRVESMQLWRRYASRLAHTGTDAPSIDVATSDFGTGLRADVNEVYLFHGTKQRLVSKIVRDGFDMRLGNGYFGRGAYFAEHVDKSDAYAENVMFLSRVILGHAFQTNQKQQNATRPPCTSGHFDPHECNDLRADSLLAIAGIVSPYREFIIYDLHQSYPEYLITYKRV